MNSLQTIVTTEFKNLSLLIRRYKLYRIRMSNLISKSIAENLNNWKKYLKLYEGLDDPVFLLLAYVSPFILERKYFVQSWSLSAFLMIFEPIPKHAV